MKTKNVPRETKKGAKAPPLNTPVRTILFDIGDKFRVRRQALGLTFEAVAEASGVSTLYISNLEKHKYDNMSIDVLYRIAEALDLDLSVQIK